MLPLRPSFQTENVVFYLERRSLFPLRHTKATDLSPAVLIPLLRRVYSLVSTLVTPAHAALQAAPKNCQGESSSTVTSIPMAYCGWIWQNAYPSTRRHHEHTADSPKEESQGTGEVFASRTA